MGKGKEQNSNLAWQKTEEKMSELATCLEKMQASKRENVETQDQSLPQEYGTGASSQELLIGKGPMLRALVAALQRHVTGIDVLTRELLEKVEQLVIQRPKAWYSAKKKDKEVKIRSPMQTKKEKQDSRNTKKSSKSKSVRDMLVEGSTDEAKNTKEGPKEFQSLRALGLKSLHPRPNRQGEESSENDRSRDSVSPPWKKTAGLQQRAKKESGRWSPEQPLENRWHKEKEEASCTLEKAVPRLSAKRTSALNTLIRKRAGRKGEPAPKFSSIRVSAMERVPLQGGKQRKRKRKRNAKKKTSTMEATFQRDAVHFELEQRHEGMEGDKLATHLEQL
jgi:hypothetical protein